MTIQVNILTKCIIVTMMILNAWESRVKGVHQKGKVRVWPLPIGLYPRYGCWVYILRLGFKTEEWRSRLFSPLMLVSLQLHRVGGSISSTSNRRRTVLGRWGERRLSRWLRLIHHRLCHLVSLAYDVYVTAFGCTLKYLSTNPAAFLSHNFPTHQCISGYITHQ